MDLMFSQYVSLVSVSPFPIDGFQGQSYRCMPSARAMNGRKAQSLSIAGSWPSSIPNQLSISGPLTISAEHLQLLWLKVYLAWWNPTTQTMGREFEGPAIGRHKDVGDGLGLFHVSHEGSWAVNL